MVYLTPEFRTTIAQQTDRVDRLGRETGPGRSLVCPRTRRAGRGQAADVLPKDLGSCMQLGFQAASCMIVAARRRNIERAGVPRSVGMKLTGHMTKNVSPLCDS